MARHEQLWAPWRLAYITGDEYEAAAKPSPAAAGSAARPDCFICRALAEQNDRANLLIERAPLAVVIANRYPYNNGHLLVAPARHEGSLAGLTSDEHLEINRLLAKYVERIGRLMNAEGFNLGLNLGRVAGAGLPGHLHWHIVPRWHGDTNFMPALAAVRVIPQSLDALWELLHTAPAEPDEPGSRP